MDCKPSTLRWYTQINGDNPNHYQNNIYFAVRDTFSYQFPWADDKPGLQAQYASSAEYPFAIFHYNLTQMGTGQEMYLHWMGEVYYKRAADWHGYLPGVPVRPGAYEYYYCLPLTRAPPHPLN